ncbi:hypothetical protein AHiyo8_34260 [Arthrobacter sp. Hiyo8]|nr:hypothetical protein AHiyo8_34260 [Arthrobacter sp. Hiyo8]
MKHLKTAVRLAAVAAAATLGLTACVGGPAAALPPPPLPVFHRRSRMPESCASGSLPISPDGVPGQ